MFSENSDEPASPTADPPATSAVTAVSLKLPPFWPNDPALWFAQIEAQFNTRGITTQDTKFSYVVSSLQPEIAQEVRDFIISPPASDKYQKLKSELIKRTSASEQKRLHQLLISEELGDRKPSQLLRKMRLLLGESKLEDNILKQLFLQRLPGNVKAILASTLDNVSLDQLAELADKIIEVATPSIGHLTSAEPSPVTPTASGVSQSSDSGRINDDVQRLTVQVAQLTAQVQALTCNLERGRKPSRDSRRSRSRSRSRDGKSRTAQTHAGSECWYHWRFGDKAKHCTSPCTHQKQEN